MNKFGILAAMNEEMKEIEKIMENKKVQKIYELNFIKGKINNTEVVLVEAGVGKVNAARTTQTLIDNFKVDAIINVGSAGSSNDELDIGDIVIGMTNLPSHFCIGEPHLRPFKHVRLALGLHPLLAADKQNELQMFKNNIEKTS